MTIIATNNIQISFVSFEKFDDELANVILSFDGEEFAFATNAAEMDAEPSRPEYDRFIQNLVAGGEYDDDNAQHEQCFEAVFRTGVEAASRYAEACWKIGS